MFSWVSGLGFERIALFSGWAVPPGGQPSVFCHDETCLGYVITVN